MEDNNSNNRLEDKKIKVLILISIIVLAFVLICTASFSNSQMNSSKNNKSDNKTEEIDQPKEEEKEKEKEEEKEEEETPEEQPEQQQEQQPDKEEPKQEEKQEKVEEPVIVPDPVIINNRANLTSYKLPAVTKESMHKKLKVLIIEIDPVLTKGDIQGVNCAGKTASECLGQNRKQAVNELIEDLNTSSNNNLDVKIVKTEKINEFATYKNSVKLLNNTTAYRFDEDTWLDIMKNGWYNGLSDPRVQNIGNWFGTYDYEYIINKLNLVARRNNNEFDEVWIVNVDPSLTYESIMVGSNAFWINGAPINKNCQPFKMINISISRPDANFECFGHATEQVLDKVFSATYWPNYNPLNWSNNSTTINADNYSKLNLFQKFMLTENENTNKNTGFAGVGNMHYSPNSKEDYDWNNKSSSIYSKYNEWSDYPNITNNRSTTIFNPSIYINKPLSGTISDARLHHRWWFGLMPHHSGYTKDGYYNNWWNYYVSNRYVVSIEPLQSELHYNKNDKLNISVRLTYSDGSKETINNIKYDSNLDVNNKSLFTIDEDRYLYAKESGTTTIKYYRDGVYTSFNIVIK